LLICSLVNACYYILNSLIMYFGSPAMAEMIESGQMEKALQPFLSRMNSEEFSAILENAKAMVNIDSIYYIITCILYAASLVGVTRMLKLDKTGLHIYSISQLCIILASSKYLYKALTTSPFWSEVMLTALFIVIYHLGFKQIEMRQQQ